MTMCFVDFLVCFMVYFSVGEGIEYNHPTGAFERIIRSQQVSSIYKMLIKKCKFCDTLIPV